MLEILWLKSYYTEVILYITMFLLSTIAGIRFSISTCRLCCSCSKMWSKFFFMYFGTSLNVITTTAGSNMENQSLKDASANGISFSTSDHLYREDRFADQIGYSTPWAKTVRLTDTEQTLSKSSYSEHGSYLQIVSMIPPALLSKTNLQHTNFQNTFWTTTFAYFF